MNRCVLVGAAVLLAAGCSSTGAGGASGALNGRVISAPSCPVMREGVDCPPRPVSGAAVVAVRGGQIVASTRTDAHGYFHMKIAQGRYIVRATNAGGYQSTTSKAVVIWAERTVVYVRLVVDSGIR